MKKKSIFYRVIYVNGVRPLKRCQKNYEHPTDGFCNQTDEKQQSLDSLGSDKLESGKLGSDN